MDNILRKQIELQNLFRLQYDYDLPNPADFPFCSYTAGDVYDFIRLMKFCLDEELTELMEALGDGTRAIHKPWSEKCKNLRNAKYKPNPKIMEEAVDALCFMANILLAAGLTPENINIAYDRVWNKNSTRIQKILDTQDQPVSRG